MCGQAVCTLDCVCATSSDELLCLPCALHTAPCGFTRSFACHAQYCAMHTGQGNQEIECSDLISRPCAVHASAASAASAAVFPCGGSRGPCKYALLAQLSSPFWASHRPLGHCLACLDSAHKPGNVRGAASRRARHAGLLQRNSTTPQEQLTTPVRS